MINSFVNTPVSVAPGATLVYQGHNVRSRSCRCNNGGWLFAPDNSGQFMISRPGVYKIEFSAQVTAATAGPVTMELRSNGAAIPGTKMGETISAANGTAQIATSALIFIPCNTSVTVTAANTGAAAITVNASSIILSRVA